MLENTLMYLYPVCWLIFAFLLLFAIQIILSIISDHKQLQKRRTEMFKVKFLCLSVLSLLVLSAISDAKTTRYVGRTLYERGMGVTRVIDGAMGGVIESCAYTAHRESLTVTPAASLYFEMATPDSFTVVLNKLQLAATGSPWTLTILEAPTMTTGSLILRAYNKNRTYNVDSLSGASIKANPTYTSGGAVIYRSYFGGQENHNDSTMSGVSCGNVELQPNLLLKKSTNYLIQLKNTTSDTNAVSAQMEWYQYR